MGATLKWPPWSRVYPLPMRNTLVLHFGQTPWTAGRLFFRVTCLGFWISTFFLHFTQYACAIVQILLSLEYICAHAITYLSVCQYPLANFRRYAGRNEGNEPSFRSAVMLLS